MGLGAVLPEYNVDSQLVRVDHGHLRMVRPAPQHRCDERDDGSILAADSEMDFARCLWPGARRIRCLETVYLRQGDAKSAKPTP